MKRLWIVLLILPTLLFAQIGSGYKGRQGTGTGGVSDADMRTAIEDTADVLRTEMAAGTADSLFDRAVVGTGTWDGDERLQVRQAGVKIDHDYAQYISNDATNATINKSKYGLVIENTGAWTGAGAGINYGLYLTTSGGTTDWSYYSVNGDFYHADNALVGGIAGTPVSVLEVQKTNIGVTQDNAYGLTLRNPNSATNILQQYSPPLIFRSYGWETATGTSDETMWRIHNVPISAAAATSQLNFNYSNNGAAYQATAPFQMTPTGLGIFKTPTVALDVVGSAAIGSPVTPTGQLHVNAADAQISLENPTLENTASGRDSYLYGYGYKADGTRHALGYIKFCKPAGTDDSQEGAIRFYVNSGTDGLAPTLNPFSIMDWTGGYGGTVCMFGTSASSYVAIQGSSGSLMLKAIQDVTLSATDNMIINIGVVTAGSDINFRSRGTGNPEIQNAKMEGETGYWAFGQNFSVPSAPVHIMQPANDEGLIVSGRSQDELIINTVDRDFSGAGNWSGTNWSIVGETLTHATGSTTSATLANVNLDAGTIDNGSYYSVTFTVASLTAGTLIAKIGAAVAPTISANGTYSFTILAVADNADLVFTPTTTFNGSIDDISVQLITDRFSVEGDGSVIIESNLTVSGCIVGNQSLSSVASAATITLGAFNNFTITGTTTIDSIDVASTFPDCGVAYIQFSGTAATTGMEDGHDSIKLNGNFVYSPDDMLVLQRRGSIWYEISRSAN